MVVINIIVALLNPKVHCITGCRNDCLIAIALLSLFDYACGSMQSSRTDFDRHFDDANSPHLTERLRVLPTNK